jgi:hypothetical protein
MARGKCAEVLVDRDAPMDRADHAKVANVPTDLSVLSKNICRWRDTTTRESSFQYGSEISTNDFAP